MRSTIMNYHQHEYVQRYHHHEYVQRYHQHEYVQHYHHHEHYDKSTQLNSITTVMWERPLCYRTRYSTCKVFIAGGGCAVRHHRQGTASRRTESRSS